MEEQEIEKVFLVKNLPEDLHEYKSVLIKIGDFFEPDNVDTLKIRQKGDYFELIKKEDAGYCERVEHVIPINEGEFNILWGSTLRRHKKTRIFYPIGKHICEIDLYSDELDGYVRAEVEFLNSKELNAFIPPGWLGEEITSLNHEIHAGLGEITFEDMKKRFEKNKIELLKITNTYSQ